VRKFNQMVLQMPSIRLLYLCAVLCFIPPLFFFYVGEEGVYTLNSIEMWKHHQYLNVEMYGLVGGRPPMINWLMIPLASLIGWENVLVAARIETIAATIGTSLIIGWLAQQLWKDILVSQTSALLYLVTADVILYRGWLSYADTVFSMFVFLAIALAWVSCIRRNYLLLAVSLLAAFAAFLTKALTAYVFLGIGMLVLLSDANYRHFLLASRAWVVYVFGVIPLIAYKFGITNGFGVNNSMVADLYGKLTHFREHGTLEYITRIIAYPVEIFIRLMPPSLFVGFFFFKKCKEGIIVNPSVRICLFIAVFNFLPYWLAPEGSVRYLLPLYPFIVLAASYIVIKQTDYFNVKKWILFMLILGLTMNLIAYPYYQRAVRGQSYVQMATEILQQYGKYPIYATDTTNVGLSVVANIDIMRFDQPAITFPPANFSNGIVIAYTPNDVPGRLLKVVHGNIESVYLICRGNACSNPL
jgi:hypothetical protein